MDTIWQPVLGEGPKYQALADAISTAVRAGHLGQGDRLPPVRDLAYRIGVTPGTVARAYRLATDRGLLDAEVGRGTFVRGAGPDNARPAPGRTPTAGLERREAPGGPLDLRGSRAPEVGQERRIGALMSRIITRNGGSLPVWDYRRYGDDLPEREAGAAWLRAGGVVASAADIVITAGAQNALAVALASAVPDRSRPVLSDSLIHPGIEQCARVLGHTIEPVENDAGGMIPEALAEAAARTKAAAVIISANCQNPTLVTMTMERRAALAGAAGKAGLAIIEDDVYGWLAERRLPSFAQIARGRCWYLTSLSKCVAAGLRLGYLLCPPGEAARAASAQFAFSYSVPWLSSGLAAELILSGEAEDIRQEARAATAERVALAADMLAPWKPRTDPGASFIWLELAEPWRASDFERACRDRDILISPASSFAIGRRAAPHAARIALAPGRSLADLREGLDKIARLLAAGPRPETTPS